MDVVFADVLDALTKLKDFNWVDEDCGQFDIYEDPPVVFPCALVSVHVPEWIAVKEPATQPGRVEVIIKLGFDVRIKTGNVNSTQITSAMGHFALVKKVTKAIRGKHGTTYRGLDRISTIKTITKFGIKIYNVTFSGTIVESIT